MVDGRSAALLQNIVGQGNRSRSAKEARASQAAHKSRQARSFAETFADPKTTAITCVTGEGTLLIVFVQGSTAVERDDDSLSGAKRISRPVHGVFRRQRKIESVADVGYHMTISDNGIASHHLVAWGPSLDVVRMFSDVTGLRVER